MNNVDFADENLEELISNNCDNEKRAD